MDCEFIQFTEPISPEIDVGTIVGPVLDQLIANAVEYSELDPNFIYKSRSWLKIPPPSGEAQSHEVPNFRFMSYNLLADGLVRYECYFGKDRWLENDTRMKAVLEKDVDGTKPDIINFQEVQPDNSALFDGLKARGYDFVYKKRLDPRIDGLLTAYKKSRFELIANFSMNFWAPEVSQLLARQNVALLTLLRDTAGQREYYLVANIHVLFSENRGDIKLVQILLTLRAIKLIKLSYFGNTNESVNVIFSGDFNVTSSSPIYQLLTFGDGKYLSMHRGQ